MTKRLRFRYYFLFVLSIVDEKRIVNNFFIYLLFFPLRNGPITDSGHHTLLDSRRVTVDLI